MADSGVVDQAIERLADGKPVDWAALERDAGSADEREALKYLRVVCEIADLHGSAPDPLENAGGITTLTDDASTTTNLLEVWGRFRLIEKVGEGTFGTVHRAWDPELEREVAIKILRRRFADAHLKERLLREGRALARVRHPNVVSVLGVEADGDRVGLCMEFVRGETLEGVLETHGVLNAREAVLVGEDVCGALAAVHLAGFVHRDVKARNVMRERTGRIVLMDFGTGRETALDAAPGAPDIAGTPAYMAPEVLTGQPASVRSDVYSVGVLLYRLVTAEYPVDGRSMEDLHEAHAQGRRRLLSERRPDLPAQFIQVVERALAADMSQRYPSAGALHDALATIGTEVTPQEHPTTASFLLTALLVAVGTVGTLTILGSLICAVYNTFLDRSGFADEAVRDWFVWGVTSLIGSTVLLLLGAAMAAMAIVLGRLVLSLSSRARRLDRTIRQRMNRLERRLGLDDMTTLASWVLLVSAVMLVSGWTYFWRLLGAISNQRASIASVEDLSYLSPGFLTYQDQYFLFFTIASIFSIGGWYLVATLAARRRQPINQGLLAGGIVIAVLAVLTLVMPYRLFVKAEADMARWNGADCYILGERGDDALLFCPMIPIPRNRIVQKITLQRLGTRENIFTKFSPPTPK